ncbi:TnsA endonuclease N-terminal domain-containing protein [Tepidibacillus marianensis]|uniref:TnsA endonuclease N-terminal domain-containing protein n=1 Tax=Tepidibacillus marianensis TaxID=3131995 RepID=UPI0030CF59BB
MPKRETGWTEQKIAKYYKEGRGAGELTSYKPWLTVQDVPSRGRSHRPKGWKTSRIHQLLSDLEFNYFCILEWADDVVDIREQFPLNREVTLNIADTKAIKHPVDIKTKTPIVMTTDFLVTVRREDKLLNMARTVKYAEELNSERQIEKFEIERAYWEEQGINWGIVTEKELHATTVENIKWFRKSFFEETEQEEIINNLLYTLSEEDKTILKVLTEFDINYKLEKGSALSMFKWMLAKKIIKIDIKEEIDLKNSTSHLQIPEIKISKERWAT